MSSYHHGALAGALLDAAGELLGEKGLAGFSLRECARRAGVSHTAPAHHYGDVAGLLTAYAARAFAGLADALSAVPAGSDAALVLQHQGVAYVRYALLLPARYQLMFSSGTLRRDDPALQREGLRAWACLADAVAAVTGRPAPLVAGDPDAALAWAAVHGIADLLINQQLQLPADTSWEAHTERMLAHLAGSWRRGAILPEAKQDGVPSSHPAARKP
ncbi:MAG TPA: TetR-like C-terminal domain-containing protein [Chitinolyticbacter sp.]|nr:TetR-like C-terminal domain-containing protein [Chitinolyticbacter sp.]